LDRLREVGIGCRNPRERCDAAFLKKSRTGRLLRVPEKYFVKVPGKISGKIVLGKIWSCHKIG